MTIRNLNKGLKKDPLPKSVDYTILAGFVIYYLGHLPETGEKFEYNGYEVGIVDRDGIKINKILVRKLSA